MFAVLYSEVNVFCILILLLLLWRVLIGVNMQNHRKLFIWVLLTNIFTFALDLLWILIDIDALRVSVLFNYWVNALYYIGTGAAGYCWLQYSELILDSPVARKKELRLLTALPALALAVLALLSVRPGWLFYIDESNIYHREKLYFIQITVAYGYVLYASIHAFVRSLRADCRAHREEYLALASFIVFPLLFGTVQTLFPGVPLVCVGITFSLLWVYFDFQERRISLDPLTQLNNRNQLIKHLSNRLRHSGEEKTPYLLMMDVDAFKSVNDRFGHVEGDRALLRVADALKLACGQTNIFIARYGGDEFVIVYEAETVARVEELCERIHAELAGQSRGEPRYPLTLSIGYAKHEGVNSAQEWIHRADVELYKVKKGRREGNGRDATGFSHFPLDR